MKKIMSLFKRDYDGDRKVFDSVTPGAEWVISGEGHATRKWDGMAILIDKGHVFKRYDAKTGRTPPASFIPAQSEPDQISGHWPGWLPAVGPESKRIIETVNAYILVNGQPVDGTYEVCGPSIGTRHGPNPENLTEHILVIHGADVLIDCPRTFDGIRSYLMNRIYEGVVWHHPDGRMVKIKKNDFPTE